MPRIGVERWKPIGRLDQKIRTRLAADSQVSIFDTTNRRSLLQIVFANFQVPLINDFALPKHFIDLIEFFLIFTVSCFIFVLNTEFLNIWFLELFDLAWALMIGSAHRVFDLISNFKLNVI